MPSADVTLHLEYWAEDLSPAQKAAYEKAEKEHNDVRNKLKDIVKDTGGKNIFAGEVFTAYQIIGPAPGLEKISKSLTSLAKKKPPPAPPSPVPPPSTPTSNKRPATRRTTEAPLIEPSLPDDDDDDEEYIPLSKRQKQKEKERAEAAAKKQETTKGKVPDKKTPAKTPAKSSATDKPQSITASNVRPTEATAIGGLIVGSDKDKKTPAKEPTVVDLTKDDGKDSKAAADSREISFSRIQGKTFPSLVVISRPSLKASDKIPADRSQLDAKVKSVLMHTATKFTEWLIQQGLVKSEQNCAVHKGTTLKLGMYSDASKFPYSGGYVWISECCPTRFVSVFNGAIFEASPHPPSVILKLIYHWSCQTNVSNVVNWVKVDNLYVKGLYTWLRSVCTVALTQHSDLMGGIGKKIEVGVISLGTTTQDGQQRQVKVEVLGVLDNEAKIVRLRAVEPLNDGERNYKKRFSKILEPLSNWVHKDSIILTDLTVDKGTLTNMGYKIVQQVSPAEANSKNSNANIMDYLRRIVPRMFQNTLSLLSRQIIQQFLNELVWREQFGNSPGACFDTIVQHIAEQTKIETKDNLITRLNKAAADPFKHWTYPIETPTTSKTKGKKRQPSPPPEPTKKIVLKKIETDKKGTPSKKLEPTKKEASAKKDTKQPPPKQELVPLETYYYGIYDGGNMNEFAAPIEEFQVQCPDCPSTFNNNIEYQDHLFSHTNNEADNKLQCRYCLDTMNTNDALKKHHKMQHPIETKNTSTSTYNCIICEQRFGNVQLLSSHMQKNHIQHELPYKCGGCDYKSSSHHLTVDHFYDKHKGSGLLQCPFCLKLVMASSNDGGGPMYHNINEFIKHVKSHSNKTNTKKCPKCNTHFMHRGQMKVHMIYAHVTSTEKVKTLCKNTANISKPKIKPVTHKELSSFKVLESYGDLTLEMEPGKLCFECHNDYDEANHMIGLLKCSKCHYQTCCLPTMLDHTMGCNATNSADSYPVSALGIEMHCVCGFSSLDGNALARHCILCDRRTVYPSVESAQDNTVKRNMLDMLGLVRREDESTDEPTPMETDEMYQQEQGQQEQQEQPFEAGQAEHAQPLFNEDGNEGRFNTNLSLDDLGPPSVLPPPPGEPDRTPQLKDDYASLATPRVVNEHDQPDY